MKKLPIYILVMLLNSELFANGDGHEDVEKHCSHAFFDELGVEVVSSGRDQDVLGEYKKLLTDFYKPGGVAERLGYARPPHQAVFTPSAHLAMLATLGRHAVPHWIDGAQLVNAHRSAGVMEFVTPGCSTCRSFYSDTTDPIHQLSVIMHVFGHNHFAATAYASLMRNADPIAESVLLANTMHEAKLKAHWGEVDHFYQLLSSFEYSQDLFTGSFEDPKRFGPELAYDKEGNRKDILNEPTPSILQALVQNLPLTAPEWKRKMAMHYERMMRVLGFYTNNKVLNEGWAVQSQMILPKYTGHNSHEHIVEYAELLEMVLGRSINLGNPYWLGREAWNRFIDKIRKRPEAASMTQEQIDQLIVSEATRVQQTYSDMDGLRLMLDQEFVDKYKLYLKKEVDWFEYDWNLPGRKQQHNTQYKIISRDAKVIVELIIDRLVNKRNYFPMINLVSLDVDGGSTVLYRFEDYKNKALKFRDTILTMLAHAQTWERSIVLEGKVYFQRGVHPVRIRVAPNGEVSIKRISKILQGRERSDEEGDDFPNAVELAQKYIQRESESNAGFNGFDYEESFHKRVLPFCESIIEKNVSRVTRLLGHAPETAGAIRAFTDRLRYSLPVRLKQLLSGKVKARSVGNGIALAVFPKIPGWAYDERAEQVDHDLTYASKNNLAIGSGDPWTTITLGTLDDGRLVQGPSILANDLGSGDGLIGDKEWGVKPKEGQGDGDGDADPDQPGDPGDLNKPGKGKGVQEHEIYIDYDDLIEILQLELPNRKKRNSQEIETTETILEGGVTKPNGEELWVRMMPQILSNGKAMLDLKWREENAEAANGGQKPPKFSVYQRFLAGMRYLKEEDIIVRDRDVIKQPETKAVFLRVMDESGSMHGKPQMIAKKFYKTTELLLKKKYAKLDIVNIGFNDHEAVILSDEEFFSTLMNGGTNYTLGWKKSWEVLNDPKYANHDKYLVMAGDFEAFNEPEYDQSMRKLWEVLNWGGAVHTLDGYDSASKDVIELMKKFEAENEWFRFGVIQDNLQSHLEVIKDFFGTGKKQ